VANRRTPKGGNAAKAGAGDGGPAYLSTHQVAQIFGVSLPTVVNWTRDGRLKAHRTPGGHRRIAREELLRFAREYEYPLPPGMEPESGPARVLVVDSERDFGDMLRDYLELEGGYRVMVADGPFEAGYHLGRFRPHLLLVDTGIPGLDLLAALRIVKREDPGADLRVVACTAMPDPLVDQRVESGEIHAVVHKPIKLEDLSDVLEKVLGNKA